MVNILSSTIVTWSWYNKLAPRSVIVYSFNSGVITVSLDSVSGMQSQKI